jgi:hypothetical protein
MSSQTNQRERHREWKAVLALECWVGASAELWPHRKAITTPEVPDIGAPLLRLASRDTHFAEGISAGLARSGSEIR